MIRPLLPLVLLSACAISHAPVAPASPTPAFSAERFFAGRTQGDGVVRILAGHERPLHVEGSGRVEAAGTLVLDQEVRRGDAPATRREWRIHPVAGGYAGSLSDAAGPVDGRVEGTRLHLRSAMGSGLRAEQWITLRAGGQEAVNRMTISKLGLPIAHIAETIRRVG